MVSGRSERTSETLGRVRPMAEQELLKRRNALAELEGGVRSGTTVPDPAAPLAPGVLEADPLSTHLQRVYEKLHVRTNTGAVAKALRERLI